MVGFDWIAIEIQPIDKVTSENAAKKKGGTVDLAYSRAGTQIPIAQDINSLFHYPGCRFVRDCVRLCGRWPFSIEFLRR